MRSRSTRFSVPFFVYLHKFNLKSMYKVHIIKKNAEKRSAAVEKGKRALKNSWQFRGNV